ncbi:DUF192 domain-containing protein [Coraliomargarita sinensis]|uniref:DUF192 domain-containing protein n=1 Tax=Coraliomargarita sinensis TaxID=2174842 RepID=A0A317ZGR3_9BACT|nr:DUF192 domain-containing protein [Coraliomargarita sinensis]PXA03423.1 DUF192 domain-containing protein [Coraliomargarita sinensis]
MSTCYETIRPAVQRIELSALLAVMSALILGGCQPDEATTASEPVRADTYFPITIGESTLQLQLALTPAEHQKGLMFRRELPEDHGMLFIFERPRQQGFWMKNTSLPLDIGYLDPSGRLIEVHPLFPFDETPVASRSRQILIAIETNRGWYAKNGVKPGAQLDVEALKAAITKRGFAPTQYAIED